MSIERIFFDLDSTLIFTALENPGQEHLQIDVDDELYFTIVRPSAKKIIEYARNLVGDENVFILTASIRPYAEQICEKAGFKFNKENIFTREDMELHTIPTAYGGRSCISHSEIASKYNVLIDDLTPRYNLDKMAFIGIMSDRYLEITPYYGTNNKEDLFYNKVVDFLSNKSNYCI